MTLNPPFLYFVWTEEYCQTSSNINKSPNLWHVTSILVCCICVFRNDGIVIAITFWQWFVESIFNMLLIGTIVGLGSNRQVDHFSSLFTTWFGTSVIPSFYFMACVDFRRDRETYGLLKAFWLAITKDSYED